MKGCQQTRTGRKPARRLVLHLVVAAASAAVLAAPAAATTTTPPRPPQPPSAYVQTANYNLGCSDWFLGSTYPSVPDPRWQFDCSSTDGDEWYSWGSTDWYYWNPGLQQAILYLQTGWDSYDWFWFCYIPGACQA
jgi:hypothetical protein